MSPYRAIALAQSEPDQKPDPFDLGLSKNVGRKISEPQPSGRHFPAGGVNHRCIEAQ
jgi:hypothetical protein